jgi:hypothetical protein
VGKAREVYRHVGRGFWRRVLAISTLEGDVAGLQPFDQICFIDLELPRHGLSLFEVSIPDLLRCVTVFDFTDGSIFSISFSPSTVSIPGKWQNFIITSSSCFVFVRIGK